jgi:hypothetical protein
MADDEPDRLSQLPDDLLQHILQLAPCREAESTAVLSRRWRGLWPPPTSAVKFDIPSIIDSDKIHRRRPDALLRGAKEALAAAQGPVKRISIHVGEECRFVDIVVGDVLSYLASRGVQDVRIIGADDSRRKASSYNDDSSWSWLPQYHVGEFEFSFGSVASAAALRLRVLHITNCRDLTPPPRASTFPCLEVLRLRKCTVDLDRLQDMVVASPQLAALQLEYVFFSTVAAQWQENDPDYYDDYSERRWNFSKQSFCCPGITTLVLLNCYCEWGNYTALELDVPRVQHFRYRGRIDQFTLRSPLPDVRRVYLHILDSNGTGDFQCETFWNFLKNFGNTKVLKLKVEYPIDYVAVPDRERFRELLGETLFNVEHLEIDARHNSTSAGVAIGNLLQCCPVILDLRLKLNTADQPRRSRNKAQLEFHKSVDHFRRRRDRPVIPMCGEDVNAAVVSDIPGFSDRWFHFRCLRFHLRRLSLQFQMDKPDCLGIQLAKFFVERGMALEEMYIDDGNMRLWEAGST